MDKKFIVLLLTAAIIAGALLFRATTQTASAVYMPSQLAQRPENLQRIRVAGKVADLPIEYSLSTSIVLSFSIVDPTKNPHENQAIAPQAQARPIPVIYRSAKPDMFAAGRDVIIDGSYENGIVQASRLLTQCPSKYEVPEPGAKAPAVK